MNLIRAQQRMQIQANKKRRDLEYQVGDWVYLKLRPYRQKSLARRKSEKLAPRYYGPFCIQKKIGKVAYKLELPPTTKIHPTFHVSQLKAAMGTPTLARDLPPQLNEDLELVAHPEEVRGVRYKHNGGATEKEVLIQWEGLTELEATWEDFSKVNMQFPNFNLEDKVKVWAAGVDKPPLLHVYTRKKKKQPIGDSPNEQNQPTYPQGTVQG